MFSLRFQITDSIKRTKKKKKRKKKDLEILICKKSVGLRNLIRFLEKQQPPPKTQVWINSTTIYYQM